MTALRAGRIATMGACCLLGVLLVSSAAAEKTTLQPASRDRCPVCGMFVAKFPDWTTAVLFKDGSRVFFDGPKDLFKYWFDPKKYGSTRGKEDSAALFVKEYYGLSWIDARTAWYVLGSDVLGPMGRELIPVSTEAEAKEFMTDHKGKRILRFSDISPEVIRSLD